MKNQDKNFIVKHYNDLFSKHGFSEKAVGWPKKRNFLRYKILINSFDFKPSKNILDFGCGLAFFYFYLQEMKIKIDYEGIDINKNMINSSLEKYPKIKVKYLDAFKNGLEKKYNFITSCGVHNTKISDNLNFIKKTFELFYKYSTEGFSMNFLSSHVDFENSKNYHADPSDILKIALSYSNNVILRHDYMPYEFSIIVHKNQKCVRNLNIYEKYKDLIK